MKIDSCTLASDVVKSDVDLLTAIRWIARAWDEVKPETISKCFRKAGVLDQQLSVVTRVGEHEEEDPFQDLDANLQLQDLIAKTLPTQDWCSLEECIGGDSSLPVCLEMDDNSWEDTFQHRFLDRPLLTTEMRKEQWMDKMKVKMTWKVHMFFQS